jgi:flavin reductase (NADH)
MQQPAQNYLLSDASAPGYKRATASVTATSFKEIMSTFPSGVTIVTTTDRRGVPHGLTCSSLCSVSLDPPLLLVCIHNGSGTLVTIRDRGVFAVNILHGDGKEAAEAFASRSLERFARVPWRPTLHWSLPHLFAHAHAIAECRVAQAVVAGNHTHRYWRGRQYRDPN